jgi:hypothetical protein
LRESGTEEQKKQHRRAGEKSIHWSTSSNQSLATKAQSRTKTL